MRFSGNLVFFIDGEGKGVCFDSYDVTPGGEASVSFGAENISMTSTPSNSSFFPDFGLSALSSLTQIAQMSQKVKDIQNVKSNSNATSVSSSPTVAQTLSSQNFASLGPLSLEAFKQVCLPLPTLVSMIGICIFSDDNVLEFVAE